SPLVANTLPSKRAVLALLSVVSFCEVTTVGSLTFLFSSMAETPVAHKSTAINKPDITPAVPLFFFIIEYCLYILIQCSLVIGGVHVVTFNIKPLADDLHLLVR